MPGKTAYASVAGLPAGKVLIEKPGPGKELVLTSITSNLKCSLGHGSAGGGTLFYAAAGRANFPQGVPWGENRHLSVSSSPLITITYWINDLT